MSASNELRLFVSSTFRDLQEEREHLVKKIFPGIRTLCRERGVTFTEIDLRWGLTDEDVVLGQVIRTCLEEIDKCRPYFIGLVGERYGWAPPLHEFYKDPELFSRWPWLEDAAMESSSITDIEFRHGALNDPTLADRARFFFRHGQRSLAGDENATTEDEGKRKLDDLKSRVREAGLSVEEFRDPVSLGELIHDELIEIIERDFADARPPTPLDVERSRHTAFAASRRRAYIPNPQYLTKLNTWVAEPESPPLILYAESGSGKSSLVSFWCEQLRRRQPELHIIEHYVGIGAGDSDHLGIIRHVIEEIKERYDRSETTPSKPDELERSFGNWLGFNVGAPMLLVLDGINQLSGRALDLHWLPPVMPAGVKLIISSTVEQTLVDLRGRGWSELGMQPLGESEREAVVVRFLAEYVKALSTEQVRRVASDLKCSHPLFLRTMLEELRLHGMHEHLDRTLDTLLSTTGTEDLFQKVLERLEDDYSRKGVREVLSLIWASRSGLSEEDLESLTGISRLKLSTLLLGMDYHLVRRDGLLNFFHDYLRRAVEKRWVHDASIRRQSHLRLAEFFEQQELSRRSALEVMWGYAHSAEHHRQAEYLGRIDVLTLLYHGAGEWEVLSAWATLRENGERVDEIYRASVNEYAAREGPEKRLAMDATVAALHARLGSWEMAREMYEQLVIDAGACGNTSEEAAGERFLARLLIERGEYAEAEARLERAQRLYEALKDRRGSASARGNLGIVHARRGEYDKALESFGFWLQISEELGNRTDVANAHGSMGIVYLNRGEYDRALESFGVLLRTSRELGNRSSVAVAHGNIGTVYAQRGEYHRALESLEIWLRISEELGDVRGVASARGNMGVIYADLGEYDRSLECHEVDLQISEELKDRGGVAVARTNMAKSFAARGEYDRALDCLRRAMAEHRLTGHRYGESYCLTGTAMVLVELVEQHATMPAFLAEHIKGAGSETWRTLALAAARENAEESVTIARDLATPDVLFTGQILLARIEAAEGRIDSARQRLTEMLVAANGAAPSPDDASHAGEDGVDRRAELHYRLWKLDATDDDHRTKALRLLESLLKKAPRPEYSQRIDELANSTDSSP